MLKSKIQSFHNEVLKRWKHDESVTIMNEDKNTYIYITRSGDVCVSFLSYSGTMYIYPEGTNINLCRMKLGDYSFYIFSDRKTLQIEYKGQATVLEFDIHEFLKFDEDTLFQYSITLPDFDEYHKAFVYVFENRLDVNMDLQALEMHHTFFEGTK